MKKSLILLSSLFLLIGIARHADAASVYFDFDGNALADPIYNITAGDPFSADVYAFDIFDNDPIFGGGLATYALNVSFNPALATANTATVGAAWIPVTASTGVGSAALEGFSLTGVATIPPVLLGSVDFTSLDAGTFNLQLGFLYPGLSFLNGGLIPLDSLITLQNSQVTAAPIPLPGAFWLFGTGLVWLVGLRKKFRIL